MVKYVTFNHSNVSSNLTALITHIIIIFLLCLKVQLLGATFRYSTFFAED